MGFRFRKTIGLGHGVRLNISKRGLSTVSIGRRGATLNVGSRGVRETFGLPGTGLSYTTTPRGGPIVAILAMAGIIIGAAFTLIRSALTGNRLSQFVLWALIALGLFGYLRSSSADEADHRERRFGGDGHGRSGAAMTPVAAVSAEPSVSQAPQATKPPEAVRPGRFVSVAERT